MSSGEVRQSTVEYYDKESKSYSQSRYKGKPANFSQHLFQTRRRLLLAAMEKMLSGKKDLTLLEIGTADGVMIRSLASRFGGHFREYVGVDISEGMIEVAREETRREMGDLDVTFMLRNELADREFDVILELGVHAGSITKEIDYISGLLGSGGLFFYTSGSKTSLYTRLKLKDKDYVGEYPSFGDVRAALQKDFRVIEEHRYAFFIPKLWKLPVIARPLQRLFDIILSPLLPNLFHETLYVLRRK